MLEEAKDFGLMNGVAVAVVLSGSRSIGSFARADRDYDEAEMLELEALLPISTCATLGTNQLSASDQLALTELSIKLTR